MLDQISSRWSGRVMCLSASANPSHSTEPDSPLRVLPERSLRKAVGLLGARVRCADRHITHPALSIS